MRHMKEETNKRRLRPITIIRPIIQLLSFILVPGLFITFFGALNGILTALISGSFIFSEQLVNILLTAAILLITILWGRVFCGFVCSFGAMQDLLWLGGKHLPFSVKVPEKADRVLKYLKYAVLLFVVIGVWGFGLFSDTVWSPWTVFGAVASPWKGLPAASIIFSVGGALLLLTIIGSLLIERFFCKYLCPLGAIYSLLSRFRVFKVKRDSVACSGQCRICAKKCSMSIPLYRYEQVSSGECINCMKCTSVCPRGNIKAQTLPAVSGTMAAVALTGVCFVGTLPIHNKTAVSQTELTEESSYSLVADAGKYKNGVFTGSAQGYRGETAVRVTVQNGYISSIEVTSSRDDREFLSRAEQSVIPAIIEEQDTDVAAVSGATYSSRGIINAVNDALEEQTLSPTQSPTQISTQAPTELQSEAPDEDEAWTTEPDTDAQEDEVDTPAEYEQESGSFTDGTYYGSGSGYRGTTEVAVTVQNGMITDITVTSYQDDYQFFSRAQSGVIDAILSSQSTDVSTVSGATFSSNSIIEAVADALGQEFTNPNSSMSGGHGHGH